MPNSSWQMLMQLEKECLKMMQKPLNGCDLLRNRDMLMPSTSWELLMQMEMRVCPKIL